MNLSEQTESTKSTGKSSTMRSLERAIDVLEVLDDSRQPLRLSEIARRADLHIATAQRILNVLESRGRVERDKAGYRPGAQLLFGAHAFLSTSPLVLSAQLVLPELATETGLTASVFVRSGWSRTFVSRVEGEHPLRYVLPTGERLPLTSGGGKVLAAHLTRDELTAMLAAEGPIMSGVGKKVSKRDLRAELAQIRAQGFSYSQSRRVPGVRSVAAPVFDREGHCIAGVQVAAHLSGHIDERVSELSVEVMHASEAITYRMF